LVLKADNLISLLHCNFNLLIPISSRCISI
jgi:hypothetical protein